jgi:hypothetical protein
MKEVFTKIARRGAAEMRPLTSAILPQISPMPLYDEQVLRRELYDQIGSYGFEMFDINPGCAGPSTGRLLQIDGLFTRCS